MTTVKKTLTMKYRNNAGTREVGLAQVKRYLAMGYKPAEGETPTFVLKPPKGQTGPTIVDGNSYPAIDEAIDNRAITVISDPAHYYDVERLIESGWEIIKYE